MLPGNHCIGYDRRMRQTQRPGIMVCTPCFGRMVTSAYMESVLRLQVGCAANGVNFGIKLTGSDALITRARAELVAHFLNDPRPTHLMFIDADIGFEPEQVFRLLRFDADVVAATYPIKEIDWKRFAEAARAGRRPETAGLHYVMHADFPLQTRNDFAKVRYAGTGFVLIRRSALERLCAAHPELKYRQVHYAGGDEMADNQHRYALFDTMIDPESGEYLSEDYAFCRRWLDLGGEIWLDLKSKLAHFGLQGFYGDFQDALVVHERGVATP